MTLPLTVSRPGRAAGWLIVACVLTVLHGPAAPAQLATNVQIHMGDGVDLDARVMKPLGFPPAEGFDGIILIHGYGGSKDDMSDIALALAIYGYASLSYSVRGQGASGGCSTASGPRERQDLLEVVNYFRNYSQINPDMIGIVGGSQGGIHSWMAAVDNMPGVQAVVPFIATPSFARDLVPNNCITRGLPRELNIGSVRYCDERDTLRAMVVADQYDSLLRFMDERDLEKLLDSVRIPVLQGLGWADFLFPANGGIRARENLASRNVPVWSYLGTNGHGEAFDSAQAFYLLDLTISWFDHWIKGFSLGNDTVPMVYYADDRPGWPVHESPVWPAQPYSSVRFYLTTSGLSLTEPGAGEVLPFSLEYDTAYHPDTAWTDLYGGSDFVSAFTSTPIRLMSEPLDGDVQVTGIPGGRINVRSDAGKFQAHVRYFDVAWQDTGYVWRLMSRAMNGVRGSVPGELHAVDLEGTALSHVVPAGHRIGVEVTSLDMLRDDIANVIPFFLSSHSELVSSPSMPSYVDIPVVGSPLVTGVGGDFVPAAFALLQNYPNPFNPSTMISFRLAKGSFVSLKVYDVLGREVAVLAEQYLPAGEYARRWEPGGLSGGFYFYRLSAGEFSETKKLVFLK